MIPVQLISILLSLLFFQLSGQSFYSIFSEKKTGVINDSGKIVIPPIYDELFYAQENLIAINNKFWGYSTTNGKITIPLEYSKVSEFNESLAAVKKNGKWGYINPKGEIIIPFQFKNVSAFSQGLAAFFEKGKWGFINTKGEVVIKPQFDEVQNFKFECAIVFNKTKEYWTQDEDGERIKEMEGVYSLINRKGEIISKSKYDFIENFHEGFAVITKGLNEGIIDSLGNEILKPEYYNVENFSEGLAAVAIRKVANSDYNFGFTKYQIDSLNQLVESYLKNINPKKIEKVMDSLFNTQTYKFLMLANLQEPSEKTFYGYVNSNGQFTIEPQFNEAKNFLNEYAIVLKGEQKSTWVYSESQTDTNQTTINETKGYNIISKSGVLKFENYFRIINRYPDNLFVAYNFLGAGIYDSTFSLIIPHKKGNIHILNKNYFTRDNGLNVPQEYIYNFKNESITTDSYWRVIALNNGFIVTKSYQQNCQLLDWKGNLQIEYPFELGYKLN
jgi:hypothetical protein